MATIFFTGFPGFLGAELLPRILARREGATAICLVQPRFAPLARARVEALGPALAPRVELVEGDLTAPGLGLAEHDRIARATTEIFHLAAIYDLAVSREAGMAVNLGGTRRVLDFAARCARLERLQYVSTCYVSGRHDGRFLESDLERGQRFNNFYEETKFLAEVEVRARQAAGLPATVYRPAITVGDSETGATQKYDGPYFVMRWLLRQPGLAVLPTVGDLSAEVNLVPRDFVVRAIEELSGRTGSASRTYHLADPRPPTAAALLDLLGEATGRTVLRVRLPLGVAKGALRHVPGLGRLMRIPPEAIDYFVQPTRYDTANAGADLAGTGVACPPLASYLPRLVAFVRAHPEIGSAAMA